MDDLTRITRELAEVDEALAATGDDFAGKHELLLRRDRLREQAAELRGSIDMDRPTPELLAELASLRDALAAVQKQRIDMVSQSGGAGGATGGAYAAEEIGVNRAIESAQGIDGIRTRIQAIRATLEKRGESIPD